MIIGSHNSWSFLSPKKWWQRPFSFMGRCQKVDIEEQYSVYDVRCFDLRLRFDKHGQAHIVHNNFDYGLLADVESTLGWLNAGKDVAIRILHDVRRRKDYTPESCNRFYMECKRLEATYPFIKFWCGRNLYNWEEDYIFSYYPTCCEDYASVSAPRLIDDWWPWIYAWCKNRKIRINGTNKDILLIDFVNIF